LGARKQEIYYGHSKGQNTGIPGNEKGKEKRGKKAHKKKSIPVSRRGKGGGNRARGRKWAIRGFSKKQYRGGETLPRGGIKYPAARNGERELED